MQNYSLGPPIETFGPNWKVVAIVVALGLLFCGPALAVAWDLHDRTAWTIFYALTALFVALALPLVVFRVWVHATGISFRGLFRQGEMRWMEVERLYFGSYEMHAHHIPLGTFYRLKLVSSQGAKLSLGERVGRADELAERIAKYTFERLLQKAKHDLDSRATLDFGAVLVSRAEGVKLLKWYADTQMRWEEIAGYDFTSSELAFHRAGKRFAAKVRTEKVPNVRVLRALLDGVMQPLWQRQAR
ncbi:MAG TPA: DUF6585 family protein [Candidatus Acidoferrum sp.]